MFAVIRTGGKQFRAEPGKTLLIPSLNVEPGTTVTFDDVLLAGEGEEVSVGVPNVEGATVTAEVLAHDRTKKITVFKRKRPARATAASRDTARISPSCALPTSPSEEAEMAHKKGVGSSRNGRDSNPNRFGRKTLRWRERLGRQHPGAPARDPLPPRKQRRSRQGRHPLRQSGRCREVRESAAQAGGFRIREVGPPSPEEDTVACPHRKKSLRFRDSHINVVTLERRRRNARAVAEATGPGLGEALTGGNPLGEPAEERCTEGAGNGTLGERGSWFGGSRDGCGVAGSSRSPRERGTARAAETPDG